MKMMMMMITGLWVTTCRKSTFNLEDYIKPRSLHGISKSTSNLEIHIQPRIQLHIQYNQNHFTNTNIIGVSINQRDPK